MWEICENLGLLHQSQMFTAGDYNVSLILMQHKGFNFYIVSKPV
jgi:hypothetical protein